MRSVVHFFILSALLVACNNPDDLVAKKEELKELKKEEASLSLEIKKLEEEISSLSGEDNFKKLIPVNTALVQPGSFTHTIELFGTVESDNNIQVHAEAAGTIKNIKVKEGSKVRKGQVLAEIDSEMIVRNINEVETSLDLAKELYQKQKRLYERKVGTEVQLLEAKNRKESLERKLSTLKTQLSKNYVKSPISGLVDEVFLNEGEMASAMTPLFRVVNAASSSIVTDVSEAYIGKVKKGDKVKVEIESLNKTIDATVASVGNFINPGNRTFKITINVDEHASLLKPNMLTRVHITDFDAENVIVVPSDIIQYDQKGNYLFVVENKGKETSVSKVYVETGLSSKNGTIIQSGLKKGDVVVVKGHRALTNGEKVKVKK